MLILSGVSGSGKSFLANSLHKKLNYTIVPSITTRKPRKGEQENKDRFFCSENEFKEFEKAQELIFCKEVFGNLYGFDIRRINTQKSIFQLKHYYINEFKSIYKNSVSIYIKPASIIQTKGLLVNRNIKNNDEHKKRVNEIEQEIKLIDIGIGYIDYVFENNYTEESELNFIQLVDSIHKST